MKYRISTEHELSNQRLKDHLQSILDILSKNKIETLLVLFGFAWGNDFNNWREMELAIKDILPILNYVEKQEYGKLGDDDLLIRFRSGSFFSEFNICHHGGIDWEFINENEASSLFAALLAFFKTMLKSKCFSAFPIIMVFYFLIV